MSTEAHQAAGIERRAAKRAARERAARLRAEASELDRIATGQAPLDAVPAWVDEATFAKPTVGIASPYPVAPTVDELASIPDGQGGEDFA